MRRHHAVPQTNQNKQRHDVHHSKPVADRIPSNPSNPTFVRCSRWSRTRLSGLCWLMFVLVLLWMWLGLHWAYNYNTPDLWQPFLSRPKVVPTTLDYSRPPTSSASGSVTTKLNNKPTTTLDVVQAGSPDVVLPQVFPTHQACMNDPKLQGILHIQMTDILGGVGTALLQLVIGQLQYADLYHLKPWIHMDNSSQVVYDPMVHNPQPLMLQHELHAHVVHNVSWLRRPYGHYRDAVPGPMLLSPPPIPQTLTFHGTGIWRHYFEPVSDFVPGDTSCSNQLYVTLPLYLITPGLHGYADYATRCWRYEYLPEYLSQPHVPLHNWLEPQRMRAHAVVQKYIRFRPYLHERARQVNPTCTLPNNACLGLHIRHSDKAAGRRRIETVEFLDYAKAFVQAGGKHIYLATDSTNVVNEIMQEWPHNVKQRVRFAHGMVRSNDTKAVFDLSLSSSDALSSTKPLHHHRTNQDALVEILALSQCQFLVHGLSAVSESAIWINAELHNRSANLEDVDRLNSTAFRSLVQHVLRGDPLEDCPRPIVDDMWWKNVPVDSSSACGENCTQNAQFSCDGYEGILRIGQVSKDSSSAKVFFIDILNQLLYAEMYNLVPWIYLQVDSNNSHVFDSKVHKQNCTLPAIHSRLSRATMQVDAKCPACAFPGKPRPDLAMVEESSQCSAPALWNTYFHPVSVPLFSDSCRKLPVVVLDANRDLPSLLAHAPWAVRAWRYDAVPSHLWNDSPNSEPLQELMRRKAHRFMKKYYRFQPYLLQRVDKVNPMHKGENAPCLGVHIRVGHKPGRYRTKVKADTYIPYMKAFVDAGGWSIYVASDSHRALHYLEKHFSDNGTHIRTQGRFVVRTQKDSPTHILDQHHRVNAETLVDILALSRCQFLLHSYSTVSEAAIYLNADLDNRSVNLERKPHWTPSQFGRVVSQVLGGDLGTD